MKSPQPNILLISSDQHRADSLGCSGHPCVSTPHLDALAYQGTRFEQACTDCPVCIPARTTLVTGIQSHHYGMPEYNDAFRIDRSREQFLGSLVTAAGYQTHLVGKTHWHTDPFFRGGFESVDWMAFLRRQRMLECGRATTLDGLGFNELSTTCSELPPHLQMTNWIVDRSLDFLATRDREQPFFLWASFQDPHPPLSIHEPYYSMYAGADIPEPVVPDWCNRDDVPLALYQHRWMWNAKPLSPAEIRQAQAVYYGMITNLDHQLGRLFGQLIADGDWNNTLVIYLSDHGEQLGDHGDVAKSTFLESSTRIPLIIRPPKDDDAPAGATSGALVELADILPTICDYAGADTPTDIDGASLRGILQGDSTRVRDAMHGQIGKHHMYRTEDRKYLYFTDDGAELAFDTQADPRDENPLPQADIGELRDAFIEHLRSENHADLNDDGSLLNRGTPRPSKQELAASYLNVQGLSPTVIGNEYLRTVLPIH